MTKKDTIHFMIMGGTIDSYDKNILYPLVSQKTSVIPDYIQNLKLDNPTKFSNICFKDSRDISGKDLKKLLSTIKKSTHKRIIITCGTYVMSDTARFLELNLKKTKKIIIFTGSMVPLYGFVMSDAPFNLGFAISKSETLSSGIYICMNGSTFSPDEITKNIIEGKFVSIFSEK